MRLGNHDLIIFLSSTSGSSNCSPKCQKTKKHKLVAMLRRAGSLLRLAAHLLYTPLSSWEVPTTTKAPRSWKSRVFSKWLQMGCAQYSAMPSPVHKCWEGNVLHLRTCYHHSFCTAGWERLWSPWWPWPSCGLLLSTAAEATETRALAAAIAFTGSETELGNSRVGHTENQAPLDCYLACICHRRKQTPQPVPMVSLVKATEWLDFGEQVLSPQSQLTLILALASITI